MWMLLPVGAMSAVLVVGAGGTGGVHRRPWPHGVFRPHGTYLWNHCLIGTVVDLVPVAFAGHPGAADAGAATGDADPRPPSYRSPSLGDVSKRNIAWLIVVVGVLVLVGSTAGWLLGVIAAVVVLVVSEGYERDRRRRRAAARGVDPATPLRDTFTRRKR